MPLPHNLAQSVVALQKTARYGNLVLARREFAQVYASEEAAVYAAICRIGDRVAATVPENQERPPQKTPLAAE
jgi:hypothetical protein